MMLEDVAKATFPPSCCQVSVWWSCSAWWRIATAACLAFPWFLAPSTPSPVSTCTATLSWRSPPGAHITHTSTCLPLSYREKRSSLHWSHAAVAVLRFSKFKAPIRLHSKSDVSVPTLTTGTSTLRGFPPTTPSPCCSGCCPTRPRSLSVSGRSSTRKTSRWWESSWTVSHDPPPIDNHPSLFCFISISSLFHTTTTPENLDLSSDTLPVRRFFFVSITF